jgi:hypothetical protein
MSTVFGALRYCVRPPLLLLTVESLNVTTYHNVRLVKWPKMEEFLAGSFFRYAVFPLGGAGLGIALKYVTRNDHYPSFRKEDMAVGLDLMLTAALTFLVLTSDRAFKLVNLNKALDSELAIQPKRHENC